MNGGGGWGIFNAILGWQNSATYGSVISYNLYWIFVIFGFLAMRHREVRGYWPLMKVKKQTLMEKEQSGIGFDSHSPASESSLFENKDPQNIIERVLPVNENS